MPKATHPNWNQWWKVVAVDFAANDEKVVAIRADEESVTDALYEFWDKACNANRYDDAYVLDPNGNQYIADEVDGGIIQAQEDF